MAYDKSWYFKLLNRAQIYTNLSYPYTHESIERANVIKELSAALRETLAENEKQADEITGLKQLLSKSEKSRGKLAKKQREER